jgi:hypothetical protein
LEGTYTLATFDSITGCSSLPVSIQIMKISPFSIVFEKEVYLKYREEKTVLSFVVIDDEVIDDIRTDLDVPMFYTGGG